MCEKTSSTKALKLRQICNRRNEIDELLWKDLPIVCVPHSIQNKQQSRQIFFRPSHRNELFSIKRIAFWVKSRITKNYCKHISDICSSKESFFHPSQQVDADSEKSATSSLCSLFSQPFSVCNFVFCKQEHCKSQDLKACGCRALASTCREIALCANERNWYRMLVGKKNIYPVKGIKIISRNQSIGNPKKIHLPPQKNTLHPIRCGNQKILFTEQSHLRHNFLI